MTTPRIVTPQEWQKEWQRLLVKEKEMTRARDATIIISCRLSFSVADTGSPTCRFAEFSSKWRTAFLIFVADPITVRLFTNSHATRTAAWASLFSYMPNRVRPTVSTASAGPMSSTCAEP